MLILVKIVCHFGGKIQMWLKYVPKSDFLKKSTFIAPTHGDQAQLQAQPTQLQAHLQVQAQLLTIMDLEGLEA